MFTSGPVSGEVSRWNASGLSLLENTLYFSTVTAEGSSGLVTWSVSDGFLLDRSGPEAGIVLDGTGE